MRLGVEGGENARFTDAPGPVAVGDAGGVHARLVAEGEDVLHGEYARLAHAGHPSLDHAPRAVAVGDAGVRLQAALGVLVLLRVPALRRFVVVRARVAK